MKKTSGRSKSSHNEILMTFMCSNSSVNSKSKDVIKQSPQVAAKDGDFTPPTNRGRYHSQS